jgi:hypothetical protein
LVEKLIQPQLIWALFGLLLSVVSMPVAID